MPAPVLQFKRGNAGVAGTVPALRPGEPAISLNNFDFFIGIDTSVANNKFFGSHRYWGREDGTNSLRLKLVDKDGTNYIAIAASNTLSGVATYRLPNTNNGSTGDFLKLKSASGGLYDLEWAAIPSGSFSIVGDTGSDSFTTGETLTFAGTANEIETSVTNNQVQIGLPNNVIVGGALTVTTGAVIDGVQIGINGANVIDTVSGNLTLNSAGGQTIIDDLVTIQNNLTVNGNITVGGTTVTLRGTDVFIENKDIILGFTTTITPNDDTANHAGVAIASTVGSPLANFDASGINTLPSTYKQMMWFKSGTLGFSTDAFGFNYGVAIGTTQMANGLRLAVGSGITMTDTAISATTVNATTGNFTNLSGSLTGTISTATRALTVDTTTAPNGTFYPGLFVNNTGTASTAVYVDAGISYVSNTDTLTLTGDIAVNGGDVTTSATTFNLINGTATNVNFGGAATALVMGATTGIATINNPTVVGTQVTQNLYNTVATNLNFGGAATALVMGATTGIGTIRNTTISFPNATTVSSGAASLTLFNTTATNITGFGAATALNLGATTGIATINNPTLVGTQATQNLYNTVATNLNFGGAATALNMGAATGIATINNATLTLPNATTVNVNGANPIIAGSSTGTLTLFNTNLTSVNAFGAGTALVMGATSGIATIRNTTFSLPNATAVNVNGASPTFSGTSTGTLTFFNTNLTSVNAFGAATALNMGATTGIATINNPTLVGTQATQNLYNTVATTMNFAGAATNLVMSAATGVTTVRNKLAIGGNLEVDGNNIQSSTGANVITLSSNNATFANDVTVNGNLYINGSTTQVNTSELTVYDRTITLGIQTGTTPSTTTWDLGVLMNYGDAGVAKTAGVIWEYGNERFVFAANSDNPASSSTSTPDIAVSTYAPIEIGALWVNDCAGQSQVISCTGTTRYLENITIDAGSF